MFRHIFGCLTAFLLLAGCATTYPPTSQRLDLYPYHYDQFDARVAWDLKRTGPELVIDGAFKNVRYTAMRDVEIWVATVGTTGKTISKKVAFLIPNTLLLDDVSRFTIRLPATTEPGSKLRFTYKYVGVEGGDKGDVGNWMQSFDAEIPGRGAAYP